MTKLDKHLAEKETEEFLKEAMEICKIKLKKIPYLSDTDKEDAAQVAIIKVDRAMGTFDSSKGKAITYFSRVIDNAIHAYTRYLINHSPLINALEISDEFDEDSEGYRVSVCDDTTTYSVSDTIIDFMLNSGLTEKEKKIFDMRYKGFDFVEIAKYFGCSKARISQIWKGIIIKYNAKQEAI
jgi:RNA polymerase sporulation-specific sigma factor